MHAVPAFLEIIKTAAIKAFLNREKKVLAASERRLSIKLVGK
jgi:hypothetical protein